DKITYVIREPLRYKINSDGEGFRSLEEIQNSIVDPFVYSIIEKQVGTKNLKDAIEDGIWMLNNKGERINKIRHIRIFAREKEPLAIKKQTHLSKFNYKHYYYAANAANYLYALYKDDQEKCEYRILSLFSTSVLKRDLTKEGIEVQQPADLFEKFFFSKGRKYQLTNVFVNGQKVIFYNCDKKEFIINTSKDEQLKKLYKIIEFEKDGRIKFKHHLEARKDNLLGGGESFVDFNRNQPKLRLSKNNLNFLIEGKDFSITPDGEIIFYD
ncbi:MAG: hypothetical protein R6W90_00430, partial [Ignavibacteriaceae bacterium]